MVAILALLGLGENTFQYSLCRVVLMVCGSSLNVVCPSGFSTRSVESF